MWSSRWNENWQGKPKYSEKTCPNAMFSTTNPTWPDLESNSGRRGGKPATNRLSYGTAYIRSFTRIGTVVWYSKSITKWGGSGRECACVRVAQNSDQGQFGRGAKGCSNLSARGTMKGMYTDKDNTRNTTRYSVKAADKLSSCSAYSSTLKRWRNAPPKRQLTFNRLHSVISHKTGLFVTTAVTTSNTWWLTVLEKR
jgi:hypothetical protein